MGSFDLEFDAWGIALREVILALAYVTKEEFEATCPYPFLVQIPVEETQELDSLPEGDPSKTQLDLLNKGLDEEITFVATEDDVVNMKPGKNVDEALVHCVRLSLAKPSFLVGRDPECDIVLNRSTVSKKHAEFRLGDGEWLLVDLGSQNGTWVDGKLIPPEQSVALRSEQNVWFSAHRAMFLSPAQLYILASRMSRLR